jgi:hypothetical protein
LRGRAGALEGNLRIAGSRAVYSGKGGEMIIKDKKLKKKLDRVPDADKNGDPIFKIADEGKEPKRKEKERKAE